MAKAAALTVRANVVVHARTEGRHAALTWHQAAFRCRLALAVYRLAAGVARIADRIDPPARHQDRDEWDVPAEAA